MVFVLSFRTNEISRHPCTTKLRFCFRLNVNYELKLCVGIFFVFSAYFQNNFSVGYFSMLCMHH